MNMSLSDWTGVISAVTGVASLFPPIWPFPNPAEWLLRARRKMQMAGFKHGHLENALNIGAETARNGNIASFDPVTRAGAIGASAGWAVGYDIGMHIGESLYNILRTWEAVEAMVLSLGEEAGRAVGGEASARAVLSYTLGSKAGAEAGKEAAKAACAVAKRVRDRRQAQAQPGGHQSGSEGHVEVLQQTAGVRIEEQSSHAGSHKQESRATGTMRGGVMPGDLAEFSQLQDTNAWSGRLRQRHKTSDGA